MIGWRAERHCQKQQPSKRDGAYRAPPTELIIKRRLEWSAGRFHSQSLLRGNLFGVLGWHREAQPVASVKKGHWASAVPLQRRWHASGHAGLLDLLPARPMSVGQSCRKSGRKPRARCECTLEAGGGKGQKGYAGFHGPGRDLSGGAGAFSNEDQSCPSIVPEPPPMAATWRARAGFGAQPA